MKSKKVIEFEKVETIQRNEDGIKIESMFWTKVDGITVTGSASFDEKEARQFYDKVVELKGETSIHTVLATQEVTPMTNEEAEHLYNGVEDAIIEQERNA